MSVDVAELQIKIGANGVDKAKRDLDGLTSSGKKAESATNLLTSAMRGLAAGLASIGIGVTVRELIQLADQYTNLSGRVRLVTGSTAAATSAMNDLYAISQRTRVGLSSTVDLYTSLSRSTQALGVSQAQVKQITETINQALIVSGTSAAAASGSLAQLGQAFASGALRGDELNSIMEGMPRVAQAIADGMGITVGQLRALGAEGELTAERIAKALLSQSDVVAKQFGQMGLTVDQAMTQVQNAVLKAVGEFDQAAGISRTLAAAISALAKNIGVIGEALKVAAAIAGVVMVRALISMTASAIAGSAAVRAYALSVAMVGPASATATVAMSAMGAATRGLLMTVGAILSPLNLLIVAVGGLAVSAMDAKASVDRLATATDAAEQYVKDYAASSAEAGIQVKSAGQESIGAALGIESFGGKAGEAAAKLWDLAAASKQAAVDATAARIAMLEGDLASARSKSRSGRRAIDTSSIASTVSGGFGLLAGDISNFLTGGDSDRKIDSEISRAETALKKLYAIQQENFQRVTSSYIPAQQKTTAETVKGTKATKDATLQAIELEEADRSLIGTYMLFGEKAPEVTGELKTMSDRLEVTVEETRNLKTEFEFASEKMAEAFYSVSDAVDYAFRALKHNDWVGVLTGIAAAVKAVQKAFSEGATSAEKFASVAGVVSSVGQAIGGRAGAGISGAASGASAGMVLGGPVGAVIGAVVGGIGGILGHDKAKKAQAYADAIKANQDALAAMNARRELELQLMEAQGRSSEALALRRADELAAMDAASAAIQAQIYALNDQAEAAAKAADVLTKAQAEGDALIAIAKNDLAAAYEREASALQDTIDTFSALAKSLGDYGKSLAAQTSANVSPLVAYRSARGAFSSTSALAATGDVGALGELQAVSQAYLEAAKAVSPDARTYARALAEVRNSVKAAEKYAKDQVSNAEEQLATLKTVVGTLLTINQSVLSVRDAIAALAVAQAQAAQIMATAQAANAAAAASVTAPKVWSGSGYAAANPDVASWAQGIIGTKGYDGKVISSVDEALSYHWMNHGKFEGRSFAKGTNFAPGGLSLVGERGPELVNLPRGAQVIPNNVLARMAGGGDDETKALLRQLIAETTATRRSTEKTEQFWRGVTNDGRSINTAAAA